MTTIPVCHGCQEDVAIEFCTGCEMPFCGACLTNDEAGCWCDTCYQAEYDRMLEEAGGMKLLRAEAQQRRDAREFEMEGF